MLRETALLSAFFALLVAVAAGYSKPQDIAESADEVRLTGRLLDSTRLPIAFAKLDVWNERGQAAYSAMTDSDGGFTVGALLRTSFTVALQPVKGQYAELRMYIGEPAAVVLGDLVIDTSTRDQPALFVKGTMGMKQHSARRVEPAAIIAVHCSRKHGIYILHGDGTPAKVEISKTQTGLAGCADIRMSDDSRSAGILALSDHCCTSYPIAQQLLIYRRDKPIRLFEGDKRAIFRWVFLAAGRRVAFYQDSLHGTQAQYYELRDVETGRLLGTWDGELSEKAPSWTAGLQ